MIQPWTGQGVFAPRYNRPQPFGLNRQTWEMGRNVGNKIKSYLSEARKKRTEVKREKRQRRVSFKAAVGAQVPTGGGDSLSSFRRFHKNRTKIGKLEFTPSIIINNSGFRKEAPTGQQESVLIGTYYTDTDVNQHFALINNAASAKIFLQSVHGESLITNQCNVNARVTIYDVIARRDSSGGAVDPDTVFKLGMADNTGGSAAQYLIPGVTPYENPRFVQWFKILQTTRVILSPGQCHNHTVNYAPNRMFSHEISTSVLSSSIGNLTVYSFMVFHGTPINDITTQTQVSTAHIALDVVQKESYHFKYADINTGYASITQSLPTAFTVAGATMQDDGVELPENEA